MLDKSECYHGRGLKVRFNIDNKWVGDNCPCFIIAEAGANHCQDFAKALKLISVASVAGADAIKFQYWKAEKLYDDPYYKNFELPEVWLPYLKKACESKGIIFLCTAFDSEGLDTIDPYVSAYKIASRSYYDAEFLTHIQMQKKEKVLLMSCPSELKRTPYANLRNTILLHCVPNYPTKLEDVHLWKMEDLRMFKTPIGFSDHTKGIIAPVVAVARGACVIEKHFTLDEELVSPDHSFAIKPKELADMVKAIRQVEVIRGG